jgi:cytochrome oxidase Cu insertion factor (SCO1/SenC/PrrC family)
MSERGEKLTRDVAEKMLSDWADAMELDKARPLYKTLVDELRYPVQLKRISFDEETETFRYQLVHAVGGKDIVEIKEVDFNKKKAIQKYRDDESMDSAEFLMSKYTNLTTEEFGMLKDRDQGRIIAVVTGFLTQIAPSKK